MASKDRGKPTKGQGLPPELKLEPAVEKPWPPTPPDFTAEFLDMQFGAFTSESVNQSVKISAMVMPIAQNFANAYLHGGGSFPENQEEARKLFRGFLESANTFRKEMDRMQYDLVLALDTRRREDAAKRISGLVLVDHSATKDNYPPGDFRP